MIRRQSWLTPLGLWACLPLFCGLACVSRVEFPSAEILEPGIDGGRSDSGLGSGGGGSQQPIDGGRPGRFGFDGFRAPSGPPLPIDAGIPAGCVDEPDHLEYRRDVVSLVIALDRSYSMFEARFGGGASRMSVLAQSLRGALAKQPGHLLVGYQEFPGNKQVCDDHSCCVGKVVPPNLVTAFLSIVDNRLLRCDSCLETSSDSPAHLAIKEAADELGLPGRLPTGPKHILLITDGDPTCQGKNQCQAALSEVSRAASADIKTTVLALVDDPKNTCLDEVALAGGGVLPASGALPFFAATSEGQIQQQVQDVVASLSQRPCRVQLDMPSPNPDRVTVRMDGKSVVRDANRLEGWNFEGTSNRTIRFYGTTCDRYRSRQVPDPDIVQPCFRCGNTRPVCR